jgi:diadenosine tetraphosphatase ApaH/serine/threonine PP2A family protein phosphatase
MGRDTSRATASGYICPSRLGTSSPKMMVNTVMMTTTRPVAAMLAGPGATCSVSRSQPGQRLGEGRLADDAVEDADRGDADLHRRQELGRVLVQVHRRLRARLPAFHHHGQARLARRGERHLRHREEAVEQDQDDEQCEVHAGRRDGADGASGGAPSVSDGRPVTGGRGGRAASATDGPASAGRRHNARHELPRRRPAGLLRRLRPPAGRDRLLAVARPLLVLGDLVNRGPASLRVLQRLRGLGAAATCLLGNHDLHLLAVAEGVRRAHRSDTLDEILAAPDRAAWLDWVRTRPLAALQDGWLCVHAGVVPAWSAARTLELAAEVQAMLAGPDLGGFLHVMYGNEPRRWQNGLQGADRWRFVVNVLTRIRFCSADGELEFATKDGADAAPAGYLPWFAVPGRATARAARGLRPLEHAGPHRPPRPAGHRHRLRLGRRAHRGARGRRTARGGAGALRRGTGAGHRLMARAAVPAARPVRRPGVARPATAPSAPRRCARGRTGRPCCRRRPRP